LTVFATRFAEKYQFKISGGVSAVLERRIILMEQVSENKKQAVGYLLGDLPESERDAFEERLFLDEDLSLSLDAAENDLVDEYLRGELSSERVVKFERNFLLAESRREKVQTAKILQAKLFDEKSVTAVAAPQISFWERLSAIFRVPHFALASGLTAIALFVLIGGFWLLKNRENNQIVQIGNENQNVSITPITQPTIENLPNANVSPNVEQKTSNANEKLKPSPTPSPETIVPKTSKQPTLFAFNLLPPMRSGMRPTLIMPTETQTVRLRVEHNNSKEYIKYRAEIRDSSGDLVWSREIPVTAKSLRKPIVLDVRGGALVSGAYELTLSGVTADAQLEEVNFYNFTVRKT
jgi:hypothetical protein